MRQPRFKPLDGFFQGAHHLLFVAGVLQNRTADVRQSEAQHGTLGLATRFGNIERRAGGVQQPLQVALTPKRNWRIDSARLTATSARLSGSISMSRSSRLGCTLLVNLGVAMSYTGQFTPRTGSSLQILAYNSDLLSSSAGLRQCSSNSSG